MGLNAFSPSGNTVTFLAATSAPTAIQAATSGNASCQYEIITAPGNVTVFMGAGKTAAAAANNAVALAGNVVTSASLVLLPGTDKVLTFPPGWYFTGITSAGNCTVYVTPGDGM